MLLISWLSEVFRARSARRSPRRHSYRAHTARLVAKSELLEDRTLLAATTFVNDTWNLVTDNGAIGTIDAGDVVDASNDPGGPAGTFILDDGSGTIGNAYGTVTTGTALGAVAMADTIQEAIGGTDVNGTVNVLAGTYNESLTINKSVSLLGAQSGINPSLRTAGGTDESIIDSAVGQSAFTIAASNVTIDGFDISGSDVHGIAEVTSLTGTVVSHNFIHDSAALGVALAAGSSGSLVSENEIYGNYAGVYLSAGSSNIQVLANEIHDHVDGALDQGGGVVFEGDNTNVLVANNVLLDNAKGIYVWGLFGNDFTGTQVIGNSITSASGVGVENTNASTLDASGNWWGTADDAAILALMVGPVDFTPFLSNGNDTDLVTDGFQGDFSTLIVTTSGEQVGPANRIQEGVDLVEVGGTVNLLAGTYTLPADSLENVLIDKALTLSGAGPMDTILEHAPGTPATRMIQISGGTIATPLPLVRIEGIGFSNASHTAINISASRGDIFVTSIEIDDVRVLNSAGFGISIGGTPGPGAFGVESVTISNSYLEGNGHNNGATPLTFRGRSEISVFDYNGNLALSDLDLVGTTMRGTTPASGPTSRGADFAFQIAGAGGGGGPWLPAGTIALSNIDVTGNYANANAAIQRYSDTSNVTFDNVNLTASVTGRYTLDTTTPPGVVQQGGLIVNALPGGIDLTGISVNIPGTSRPEAQQVNVGGSATGPVSLVGMTIGGILVDANTTTEDLFAVADMVVDGVDVPGPNNGILRPGEVFITPNSFYNVLDINGNVFGTTAADLQRAVDVAENGDIIHIQTGTYTGSVNSAAPGLGVTFAPGAGPGQTTIMGDFTLDGDDTLEIEIDGAALDFDQFLVTGTATLGNSNLDLSLLSLASVGTQFAIIDGSSPIMGEFAGLADGSTFTLGLTTFMIDYQGGDGNDVVLTVVDVTFLVQSVGVTGTTPTVTDNDYTRINNAVQAAPAGANIILEGNFDWRETNAMASWAAGSDGLAGNGDDYSILAPANRNNVTITAAAPVGGTYSATIQGPGDLANINLEGVFVFDGGDNQNLEISNLEILDFDLAIGMFNGAGGSDAFAGTQILNNHILVATDLNTTVAPADVNQNIGIHFSFGQNQTIQGNIIDFGGDGISDSANNRFATSVGMQSNTSGGTSYDGLLIDGNILNVLNAQSADPENILGIWENAHGHLSDITVSNNSFNNLAAGNDSALNLQRAFRLTSHSSATTTVTYSGNTVNGANIGFQYLAGQIFGAHSPIVLTANTVTDAGTAFLIQSGGSGTLTNNVILNAGTAVSLAAGSAQKSSAFNNSVSGSTVAVNNADSVTFDASGNWWGTVDEAAIAAQMTGLVDFTPFLASGTDDDLLTAGFQGDFSTLFVTTLGEQVGPGERIQEGVDLVEVGGTVNVLAGLYIESVTINKSVSLLGAQPGINPSVRTVGGTAESIIDSAVGQSAFTIAASNVTIDGFDISGSDVHGIAEVTPVTGTVVSHNFIHDSVGLGVALAAGSSGSLISENEIYGNYAGVYLSTGSSDINVLANEIRDHVGGALDQGGGVVFEGDNTNVLVANNVLLDNAKGIYVWGLFGDDFTGTQVVGNSITSASGVGVENTNASTLDASGNWWGTTDDAAILALLVGPVDFTPFLISGTDQDLVAAGFQGDFSTLVVTTLGEQVGPAGRIQEGVDLVDIGGTVLVNAGTYDENVLIDKNLTLRGATGTAADVVIDPASGNGITIAASGADATDRLTVEDLTVTGAVHGVYIDSAVSFVELNNVVLSNNTSNGIEIHNSAVVSDLLLDGVIAESNGTAGLRVATTGSVNGLTINGGNFDDNVFGLYVNADLSVTDNQNDFTDINITGTTFNGNSSKGIYVEKLDDAVLDGITVDMSGTGGAFPAGIDINLKRGDYSSITIQNSSISDSGVNPSSGGALGLTVKVRNDGVNGPTSLDVLTVANTSITGSVTGLFIDGVATVNLSALTVTGNTAGGTLSNITDLNLTGTVMDDTFDIDDTQVMADAIQALGYTAVTNFTISGDDGSDTFNVDPISTTLLTINGDDPAAPADPGDTLNYNGPGTINFTASDSGTITQAGFNDVEFTGIETITTENVSGSNGSFTINAGADADDGMGDEFIVRQDGSGNIEVLVNGQVVFSEPAASVTDLTIEGSSDDDTLTVDYANGSPVPDGGLEFEGGGPDDEDEIILQNGTVTSVTHNFESASSGSIEIVPTTGAADLITYTGLEPITDLLVATDRTFNFGAISDEVTLSDNETIGDDVNRISSANSSETVDFLSPTATLTVNMDGGDDTLTLDGLDSTFAADVTINGGNGRDTFDLLATAGTGTYQLNGEAGADEFNITPVATGGAEIIIAGGSPGILVGDVLNYDGSGSETVTVTGTGSGTISDTGVETVTFSGIETLNTANPPRLSIMDAQIVEGTGGTSTLVFTVTLSNGSLQPVTVTVGTDTGLAIAGEDFQSVNQTLTFSPGGPLTQTFSVPIITDDIVELDEPFFAILSDPSGAAIENGVAAGLIIDDDGPAILSIDDLTELESVNDETVFEFTVTLDGEVDVEVSVDVTTMMGTGPGAATAGDDYVTTTQTLTFLPGETTKTFRVQNLGDTIQEFDEFFQVVLSNVQAEGRNVQISSTDGTGTGIIENDDSMIVVGSDVSDQARINVFDQTGFPRLSILAFEGFGGGVRVATGDFTGDGTPDIVAAAGPGGGPHIRIFDGVTGEQIPGPLGSFFAFDPSFSGGLYVALADFNGDMQLDIVVGADAGGGPHVRVIDGSTGAEIRSFFAFETTFTGGVRVAAGDVTGDTVPDIIAAKGPGDDSEVRVFDGSTGLQLAGPLGSFLPYGGFNGGVYVAAGDLDGDMRAEIITGAGAGGGPHVKVFSPIDGSELLSFFAFDPKFSGGVRVSAGDMNGDGQVEIIAAAGPGGGPHVRSFIGTSGLQISFPLGNFFGFELSYTGGVFVAGVLPQESPAPMTTSLQIAESETQLLSAPAAVDEDSFQETISEVDEFFADKNLLGELLTEEFA